MNRLLLIIKYGFAAFWYSKLDLNLENASAIYKDSKKHDFLIRWDHFYLKLTISELKLNHLFIYLIWVREYLVNLVKAFSVIKKSYFIESVLTSDNNYIFLFPGREDLQALFYKHELISSSKIITFSEKYSFSISLTNIIDSIFCTSFDDLFISKINKVYFNIDDPIPNSFIYLYEGRSLEYRALYKFLKIKGYNISFFWSKGSSYHYPVDELMTRDNLDYPETLVRPEYKIRHSVRTINKLTFEDEILVVVPTFLNNDIILSWISKIRNSCDASVLCFSLHPTAHSNLVLDLLEDELIDIDKVNYLNRYNNFIGFDSNLLILALNSSKNVFPIAINLDQIDYLEKYSEINQIYYLK